MGGSLTDADYNMQKQSEVTSGNAPAVLLAFDTPRSEHYTLTQLDSGGRTDQGAYESMTDRSLGFVEATDIEVGIQNQSVSKFGVSGFVKRGAEFNGDGGNSNGKSPLSVAPVNATSDPTSFPAMIKASTSKPYGSALKGPVSGVQSDTMSGIFESSKSGLVTNGIVPKWRMGDREVDAPLSQSMASSQQVEAPLNSNPCGIFESSKSSLVSIVPKWRMGDREVDAALSQSMASAQQVEAPLNSNPCHSGLFESSKSGLVTNGIVPKWRMGDREVDAPLSQSMASAQQVEAPLNSNPCQSTIGTSTVSGTVSGSFGFSVVGISSQSEQNGHCKMDMESGPHGNSKAGFNNGNGGKGKAWGGNNVDRNGNPAPVKSWKNLFSVPTKSNGQLQYSKPQRTDGKFVVKAPEESVMEGIDMWKGCLVGQFLDKKLPFPVVRSLVNKLWGKKEMSDISTTENGLYFFRFRDLDARNWVMDLEHGTWLGDLLFYVPGGQVWIC